MPQATRTPKTRTVAGVPSWRLASSTVELHLTREGGHLAPITFDRRGRKLRPMHVAPWAGRPVPKDTPAVVRLLRGDFFCLPFGANETPFGEERHPVHGEPAGRAWQLGELERDGARRTLHLHMRMKRRPGRVDKAITLIDGHDVVYQRHTIRGMSGPMPLGHHATLRFPEGEGTGLIATSGFNYGYTFPGAFEQPQHGGYSILKPRARFRELSRVPRLDGADADLSRYPAHRGFEDAVLLPNKLVRPFAWTAVTFPGQRFVWFALKDPRVLRSTMLWISNGGRHYPPWSGRHINVMGLEDVTAYFSLGLAESAAENELNAAGIPTCVELDAERPLAVNYLFGTAGVPARFGRVAAIEPAGDDAVRITDEAGAAVEAPVDHGFVSRADGA